MHTRETNLITIHHHRPYYNPNHSPPVSTFQKQARDSSTIIIITADIPIRWNAAIVVVVVLVIVDPIVCPKDRGCWSYFHESVAAAQSREWSGQSLSEEGGGRPGSAR